jgi:hypothetical protein
MTSDSLLKFIQWTFIGGAVLAFVGGHTDRAIAFAAISIGVGAHRRLDSR